MLRMAKGEEISSSAFTPVKKRCWGRHCDLRQVGSGVAIASVKQYTSDITGSF